MIHIEEDLENGITAHLVCDNVEDCVTLLHQLLDLVSNEFYWPGEIPPWAVELSDIYHCCSPDIPIIVKALESVISYTRREDYGQ